MSAGGASYEPLLNGRLAELLTGEGLDAQPERKRRGTAKRFDVTVTTGGLVVALEAEIGDEAGARRDAEKRLEEAAAGQVVAEEAVAVVYPAGLDREDFGPETEILWARQPQRPGEAFTAGTVKELAAALRRLPQDHGDPDRIAKDLRAALERAVAHLSDGQQRRVCKLLDLPIERVQKDGKVEDVTEAAAKRGLLVVLCAAMFHARLGHLASEPAPAVDARDGGLYAGAWPPDQVNACVSALDVVGALFDAWQTILALDYRPIFESACRVLAEPDQDARWAASIKQAATAGVRAARNAAGSRHDLLGRIFHWLLDTARYDGSYYTSSPAAALLAGLAIRPEDLPDDLSEWRVIDPACGTGTLLMAAAQRVHDLRGPGDAVKLLEDSITGLDINTTACHMAATTLGLLSPTTQFHRMNIERMLYGVQNPGGGEDHLDPRLGALELLDPKAAEEDKETGQRHLQVHWSSGEHIDTGEQVATKPNSQDLVIMNPPYTRDSLRYDHLPPAEEEAMKDREKNLMGGRAGHGSSLGTMFIDLGEHLAKLDGAALAVVYPQGGAAAPSALRVRELLAEWFHIEWVVTSHDPARAYFSENTNISEMLLVGRRHPAAADERPPTKFVRLRRNPDTAADAVALANALSSGAEPPGAEVSEWPAELMAQGRWEPVGIRSRHLRAVAGAVSTGGLFPVKALGEIALVGPAGQAMRGACDPHPVADDDGRRALWHNDTELTQTLQARTDTYFRPKPGKHGTAAKLWAQRSPLLLAAQPRLNTGRVVAVTAAEPTVGSAWVPVRPDPEGPSVKDRLRWAKALTVWWNSTLGTVSIIAAAKPNTLSRVGLPIDTMRSLPVPALTAAQAADLAAVFDRHATVPLRPLYDPACPVRSALDAAVAGTLGCGAEDADRARAELASEPSTRPSPRQAAKDPAAAAARAAAL